MNYQDILKDLEELFQATLSEGNVQGAIKAKELQLKTLQILNTEKARDPFQKVSIDVLEKMFLEIKARHTNEVVESRDGV